MQIRLYTLSDGTIFYALGATDSSADFSCGKCPLTNVTISPLWHIGAASG